MMHSRFSIRASICRLSKAFPSSGADGNDAYGTVYIRERLYSSGLVRESWRLSQYEVRGTR